MVRALNLRHRGVDATTDVLSFSMREGEGGDLHPALLGDVVVSVDQAARQAGGDLEAEILRLLAHGLCHLLGMDHATARETKKMRAVELRLLAAAGLAGESG